ncbi:MAG: hypothetical protein C4345_12335 [Chloroflexota bacterium]
MITDATRLRDVSSYWPEALLKNCSRTISQRRHECARGRGPMRAFPASITQEGGHIAQCLAVDVASLGMCEKEALELSSFNVEQR